MTHKTEVAKGQTRNTNKNLQTQTTVWLLPEGRELGIVKGEGGQIYGDEGRFDFDKHTTQYTDDVL